MKTEREVGSFDYRPSAGTDRRPSKLQQGLDALSLILDLKGQVGNELPELDLGSLVVDVGLQMRIKSLEDATGQRPVLPGDDGKP